MKSPIISTTSVREPPPLFLKSRIIPSTFCAFSLMSSAFISSEAFLPLASSKSALKLGKLMNPYFLPFAPLMMILLAKVSSIATSSRIIFTSLMVPSFFLSVRTTSVPFSPRIKRTASSTNIPVTLIGSSPFLD